jgi:hypothetical protein
MSVYVMLSGILSCVCRVVRCTVYVQLFACIVCFKIV